MDTDEHGWTRDAPLIERVVYRGRQGSLPSYLC
ncbi:MAG: hypothetical protein ACI8V5_004332, partial [Limisphaerales bacterium]